MIDKPDKQQLTVFFLATNYWYDTPLGNTTRTPIETARLFSMFESGRGVHKVCRYIIAYKPVNLLLSYLYFDHIIFLPLFNKFRIISSFIFHYYKSDAGHHCFTFYSC